MTPQQEDDEIVAMRKAVVAEMVAAQRQYWRAEQAKSLAFYKNAAIFCKANNFIPLPPDTRKPFPCANFAAPPMSRRDVVEMVNKK